MFKKWMNLIVLLVIASLVIVGCSPTATEPPSPIATEPPAPEATEPPAEEAPEVYKIGVGVALTGPEAASSTDNVKAYEMAAEEINAAGGINGHPIELVIQDDQCAAEAVITALQRMNSLNIPLFLDGMCSTSVMGSCQLSQDLGIVFYAHGTNPRVPDVCGDLTFQTLGNDTAQGQQQAELAEWLGAKKVAIVYVNNDYGIGIKDAFIDTFKAKGGEIQIEMPVMADGTDFRTEIAKLKEAQPEYTLFEMYGTTGVIFLKQAFELGFDTQFIGDTTWSGLSNLELAGDASNGMIALQMGDPDSSLYKQFIDDFTGKYGHTPAYTADWCYDQVKLAAKAIELGGYTAAGIRDATPKVAEDYVGPSGSKKMTENRHATYILSWVKYEGGKIVSLER